MNFRDTLSMTAAGVFVLSVATGAQSQAPRPAGSASEQSNSAMNRTVTVVGCLQRDTAPGASGGGAASTNAMFKLTNVQPATGASATGAPAPSRSGDAPGNSSSSSASEQAPARGRSSQTPSADAPLASEYRLMAMGGVDLAPHVGHKMQLSGTITPAADTAAGAGRGRGRSEGASPSEGAGGASSTQSGRSGNPGGYASGGDAAGNTQSGRSSSAGSAAGGPPTLHVTAATMVAQSCQ